MKDTEKKRHLIIRLSSLIEWNAIDKTVNFFLYFHFLNFHAKFYLLIFLFVPNVMSILEVAKQKIIASYVPFMRAQSINSICTHIVIIIMCPQKKKNKITFNIPKFCKTFILKATTRREKEAAKNVWVMINTYHQKIVCMRVNFPINKQQPPSFTCLAVLRGR